jgi:hypothetical protein
MLMGRSRDSIGQTLFLQRAMRDQARPHDLSHRFSNQAATGAQEAITEDVTAREASRALSWSFSEVSLFPPQRASCAELCSSRTVTPLPTGLQAKLVVGAVEDPLEQGADCVADQVMRMPNLGPSIICASPQISRNGATALKPERTGPDGAAGEAPAMVSMPGAGWWSCTRAGA